MAVSKRFHPDPKKGRSQCASRPTTSSTVKSCPWRVCVLCVLCVCVCARARACVCVCECVCVCACVRGVRK